MRMGPPWSHDYPRGEMHFMKIIEEITQIRPRTDGSNILSLDDPELFNYPVAYMAEPGFWTPSDKQAESFRAYLQKGGFVIFDDFRGYDWENLQAQMRRVLPDWHWVELDGTHAIFHSFFEIDNPLSPGTSLWRAAAVVLGNLRGQRSAASGSWRSPTSTTTSASTGNGPTPDMPRSIYRTKRTSSVSTIWCMG